LIILFRGAKVTLFGFSTCEKRTIWGFGQIIIFNFSPVPAGYGIFCTRPFRRRRGLIQKTLPFGQPQPFSYKSLFSFQMHFS
jgi:hypothetical protein